MTTFFAGKRAKELADVAARQGFEYRTQDRTAVSGFTLLEQAEDRNVPENVLLGRMRSHDFVAFDLTYLEDLEAKRQHSTSRPWVPYDSPAQFTCVVVDLDAAVPQTILNPRARKRLFAAEMELETESAELTKLFQLWSELPNMARWICDARFVDFLANTKGRFAFELGDEGLLCIAQDVRSQDLLGLIAMGIACADSLPTGLLKAYHRTHNPGAERTESAPVADEGSLKLPPGGQVTDLREVRSARDKLKAGRRSASPGTTRAAPEPRATPTPRAAPAPSPAATATATKAPERPAPPEPEVWAQWLEEHADEVSSWAEGEQLPDWAAMTAEEREAELAELSALAQDGLITAEELEEARRYLGA